MCAYARAHVQPHTRSLHAIKTSKKYFVDRSNHCATRAVLTLEMRKLHTISNEQRDLLRRHGLS